MDGKRIIIALILLGMPAGGAFGAEVRFSTARTYVAGYEVQGNYVLPVMGIIRDEVRLSVGRVAMVDDGHYAQIPFAFSSTTTPQGAGAVGSFLQDTIPPAGTSTR